MTDRIATAKLLAQSTLLPREYQGQPANILNAWLYADMIGLPLMAAITGLHIMQGKPTASAGLIGALVRRAGHTLRVSGDDTKAVAEIIRTDDPDFVFRAEWTLARAETAGLTGKTAGLTGKGVWQQFPAAMLKARAITEVARDACEDSLCGVHYTPEELGADTISETPAIVADNTVDNAPAEPVNTPDNDSANEPEPVSETPDNPPEDLLAVIHSLTDVNELRELWNTSNKTIRAIIEARVKEL